MDKRIPIDELGRTLIALGAHPPSAGVETLLYFGKQGRINWQGDDMPYWTTVADSGQFIKWFFSNPYRSVTGREEARRSRYRRQFDREHRGAFARAGGDPAKAFELEQEAIRQYIDGMEKQVAEGRRDIQKTLDAWKGRLDELEAEGPQVPPPPEPTPETRELTTAEYAEEFGVSQGTAARWCRKGHLKAVKRGRRWVIFV